MGLPARTLPHPDISQTLSWTVGSSECMAMEDMKDRGGEWEVVPRTNASGPS